MWSCGWCWWSVPLPQSFLPCIAMSLSVDQWAWKEGGTFGICAVLCKISNRTSLLLIQYKYLFILKQMPVSAKYLHVRGARERPSCSYDCRSGSTGICSDLVHKYLTAWFGFLHFTIHLSNNFYLYKLKLILTCIKKIIYEQYIYNIDKIYICIDHKLYILL